MSANALDTILELSLTVSLALAFLPGFLSFALVRRALLLFLHTLAP